MAPVTGCNLPGNAPLVNKSPVTTDIRGQLVVLGAGTSVGVPVVGCGCAVCQGGDPRNQRTRCAVVMGLPDGNLLIDTPPDLRTQLLREQIGIIHSVLYTHGHADHIFGLDELRLQQFYLGHPVPLYCEPVVEDRIRRSFDYAFDDPGTRHAGAIPQLEMHSISTDPFEVLGSRVTPIRLQHGPRFEALGFRVGDVAYCTDANAIPAESWSRLEGLDVFILDALRVRPHATHFSLDEAVAVAERVGAAQTYFTHMNHEVDHHATNDQLPASMELAYDGLRINLV